MNRSKLYSVRNLEFEYQLGSQRVHALSDVSLDVEQQDFLCLSGPSGSGKTTLLNVLGLIEPIQKGDVHLDGQSLKALSDTEKNKLRRHKIGFVFQTFQLFPVLRADENVEYFLSRQGVARSDRQKRVREALEAVGLWEHRAKKPLEMSGGQRQRVAVARALAKNPEVIIADEPTANLDQETGKGIMEIFRQLNQQKHVTVLVSSHDPMVQSFATRQIKLKDGRIC